MTNFDKYKNTLQVPSREAIRKSMGSVYKKSFGGAPDTQVEVEFKKQFDAYEKEESRLIAEFKNDLFREHCVTPEVGEVLYRHVTTHTDVAMLWDITDEFGLAVELYNNLKQASAL